MAYQTPWLLKTSAEVIVNNLNSVSSTIKNVSGSYETFSAKVNGDINYLSGAIESTSSLLDSKITTLSNEYGLFSANTDQSIGEIKNALQTSSEWVNRSELSTSSEWVNRSELSNSGDWVKRDELANSGKWVDRDELSQSSQWVNRNELSTSSNWNYAYDYIKGASGNIQETSAWVSTNGTNVIESASNALQWTNDFIKNSGHLIAGSNITITTSTNGIKIDSIGGDVPETYDLVEGDGISISSNDTQCKISVKDDYFNGKYQVAGNYLSANALNGVSGDWIKRNELANSGDWIKKDEFVYDIGISGKVDENGKLHLSAFGGEGSLNPPTNNGEWIYKIDNEESISGWYDISQDSTQLVGVNGVEVNVGETATTIGLSGGMLEISAGQGIGINKEGNTLVISANGGGGIASVEVNAPLSGNGTHEEPIGIDGGVKELTGGNKIDVSADGDKIVISYTGGEGIGNVYVDETQLSGNGTSDEPIGINEDFLPQIVSRYRSASTDTDSGYIGKATYVFHENYAKETYNYIEIEDKADKSNKFKMYTLGQPWRYMLSAGQGLSATTKDGNNTSNGHWEVGINLPENATEDDNYVYTTNGWKNFEVGDYLPLSGGTVSGDINVSSSNIVISGGNISIYHKVDEIVSDVIAGLDSLGSYSEEELKNAIMSAIKDSNFNNVADYFPFSDGAWIKRHDVGNANGNMAAFGVQLEDGVPVGRYQIGGNGQYGWGNWSMRYSYPMLVHPKGTEVSTAWSGDKTLHIILEDED